MKIAVTGATGFIGSHLTEALVANGHQVTCLARSPKKMTWIRHLPIRAVYGDLGNPESLRDFVAGQDVVVHAAGLTNAVTLDEFVRVNVRGTESLLSAVKCHDPRIRRFIYISSQAAMGPCREGVPLTEDAEQRPVTMYGASKSMAEKSLRGFRDTISMTIIRPPVVYGPRDKELYAGFRLVNRGIAPVIGHGNMVSLVYVKNLVQGICLAIDKSLGSFRSYFFTDGRAYTWDELISLISRTLGRKPVRIKVPGFMVRAAASLSDLYSTVSGRTPLLSRDKIEEIRQKFLLVSDQRARSELGYRPLFTTEEGIAESAEWYRAEGWL